MPRLKNGVKDLYIFQHRLNHGKHLRGMEEIKIRINIKMQTDIKYIPALGSSVVKKMYLKKNINARNAAEK